MKKTIFLSLISIITLQSCSNNDDETITEPTAPNSIRIVENVNYGKILTDADGMTLYFFSNDTKGTPTCTTGSCAETWPAFYSETLTLDSELIASDFATITVDGRNQTTYKGFPLYYYIGDETAGETNGNQINNIWYVAKPDYSIMYAHAQLVGKDVDGNNLNFKSDYTPGDELTFYMTDSRGRTLYTFSNDTFGVNNFTDSTFSNNDLWPVFYVDLNKLPSILDPNDFSFIMINGLIPQITYKGWPLYYYGGDSIMGDNYGISFPSPGVWPIANSDTTTAP